VAQGYFDDETATREVFGARLDDGTGPFVRTGDLGCFTSTGGLCITGRKKDLIIVRGINHHPHDIEATVEAASRAVRPGCSAAFGVERALGEEVVVVAEHDGSDDDWASGVETIRAAVSEDHDVALLAVVFIPPGHIPKTASGKVRRSETKRLYEGRALEQLYEWTRAGDERTVLS
jgi:acyl-CoA synthetase (AMP-forming)/AMP-acid ligase II